jgi:phage regulator Rha-like protein
MSKINKNISLLVSEKTISEKIYYIRSQKVMLDKDLALLYGVATGNLNKAVKRNIERFPDDFMFQLTKQEFENLKFQFGISSWGGTRKLPYVFTEQGVAMLSSVLNSKQAIAVNIQIIRVFTRMRELVLTHKDVLLKLEQLEKTAALQVEKNNKYDEQIRLIFAYIKELLNPKLPERKPVGYKIKNS